jgi:putative drug exporter of the RND superfamily
MDGHGSVTAPATRDAGSHTGALARLATGCARHPWRAIGVWVVVVVGILLAASTIGGTLVDKFTIPGSDAQRATDLLTDRFPAQAGDSATVVFALPSGRLDQGAAKGEVRQALAAAREVPKVTGVGQLKLSENGRIGYVDVQFSEQSSELGSGPAKALERDVRDAVAGSGVQAEFTGAVIQNAEGPQTGTSELIGVLAAVIILLLVLGSAVAMGLPILLALVSLVVGLSLITLAAALTDFNTITPTLAVMLGLGVGIDYALFIVTRFRQALHDGQDPESAAATAVSTAGRAVIFAGITVAISISGLAIIGLDFVTKLGLGAAMTVVVSVIAAVTLLPAVLRLLGPRIDRGRPPFLRVPDDSQAALQSSRVARWAGFVTRNAWASLIVAVAFLVLLATPALTAQLGSADAGTNPSSTTTRKAYDLLVDGFGPGFNGPLVVAVDQAGDPGAAARLAAATRRTTGVASVSPPQVNPAGDTAVVTVYPDSSPQSQGTKDLVNRLRDTVVPLTLAGSSAKAYVGGPTAANEDIAARIGDRLPYFLLVVIGVTMLLIAMSFRSAVLAVKAALCTLLSSLAAYGVVVAVFQHGWGAGLIGLDRTGPIETFLPVLVFAILFGLSMDYEVFLVSRIREEYVNGDSARAAVRHGMGAIGRVVMAAGAIMTVVFLSFMLGDDRTIKEFGLALGVGIFLDAFVVRMVVVPAVMHLLGERAWWMPRWMSRGLPRLTIEPPSEARRGRLEPASEGAAP